MRFIALLNREKAGLAEKAGRFSANGERPVLQLLGDAAFRAMRKVVPICSSEDFTKIFPL